MKSKTTLVLIFTTLLLLFSSVKAYCDDNIDTQNETETINSLLCYESYSALLRIICSTLLMKKIYLKDLKSILDFLNPLISYLDLIGQKTPNAPILF